MELLPAKKATTPGYLPLAGPVGTDLNSKDKDYLIIFLSENQKNT
jgi:hypothetical protein